MEVMVWSKLQDVVADHPQLRATAMAIYPAGFVGKWIQGKVKSSVARTAGNQSIWSVHYCGIDQDCEMKRSRLETSHPGVPPDAVFTGLGDPAVALPAPQPAQGTQPAAQPAPQLAVQPAAQPVAQPGPDIVRAGVVDWTFLPVGATPVKIANVPKASTYCSICLTDDAFSRNILSTKTCIPIHDPVKRNQKRKRDDPFCMCWEVGKSILERNTQHFYPLVYLLA